MSDMLRKDREITDVQEILTVLDACEVCRIAMPDDENGVYMVPLNFGYTYENDTLRIYCHGAKRGKRSTLLHRLPRVCVEWDTDHALIAEENPCANGYAFASVIGNGTVQYLESADEKITALNIMMQHLRHRTFTFDARMVDIIEVVCVTIDSFTGKRRKMPTGHDGTA